MRGASYFVGLVLFLFARPCLAEDAAYPLATAIDCKRDAYQSVAVDYSLPIEILFLLKFDTRSVRLVTASLGTDSVGAGLTELHVSRPYFGAVFSLDGVRKKDADQLAITGTVEVFDAPTFCSLLQQGLYLRLQNGAQIIATVRLLDQNATGSTSKEAFDLSLDRIGWTYFDQLRFFLGNQFLWLAKVTALEKKNSKSLYGTPPIEGDWANCFDECWYSATFRSFYNLLALEEAYGLQRSTAFDSQQSFKLSHLPIPKSFADRCMRLGDTERSSDLCVLPSGKLGLATELPGYVLQVDQ